MSYLGGRTIYIDSDGNEHFDYERDYEPKPTTNYDRIVSKTPTELAKELVALSDRCPDGVDGESVPHGRECFECWLDWLKQEVDT